MWKSSVNRSASGSLFWLTLRIYSIGIFTLNFGDSHDHTTSWTTGKFGTEGWIYGVLFMPNFSWISALCFSLESKTANMENFEIFVGSHTDICSPIREKLDTQRELIMCSSMSNFTGCWFTRETPNFTIFWYLTFRGDATAKVECACTSKQQTVPYPMAPKYGILIPTSNVGQCPTW